MLASDLNNTDFAGARNGDELLSVEFVDYAAIDRIQTEKKGVKVYRKECPYVRISVPGQSDKTEVFRPAEEEDVHRFPKQWMRYQMETGKIAMKDDVVGWKLSDWDELQPDTVRHLNFLRFYTVEQLAAASDMQVQGIGLGGPGMKERARQALQVKNSAVVNAEIAKRDELLAKQGAELEELKAMMKQLLTPKKGRPRKVA